jgi:hypothetical protein
MFRGEVCRLCRAIVLVECLFGETRGFLTFERKLFSEARRVDRGSHLMPLAMHREHAGNCTPHQPTDSFMHVISDLQLCHTLSLLWHK